MLISARPRPSTAISPTISSSCGGAGSTAGSRGSTTASTSEPAVRVFVMGGGSGRRNAAGRLEHGGFWREAAAWPLPQTEWTPFLPASRPLALSRADAEAARAPLVLPPIRAIRCRRSAARCHSGEPVMRGGAYDQRTGPQVFGAQPALLPARRARRRAVVCDAAARRGSGDRRAGRTAHCGSLPTARTPIFTPS